MSSETISSGNISNANAKKLTNAKAYFPSDWSESRMQLKQYGVLLGVILGHDHPNVKAHFDALDFHEEVESEIQRDMTEAHGSKLAPSLFNFAWCMHHRSWFGRQWQSTQTDTVRAPDLEGGLPLYQTQNQIDWLP